MNNKILTVIIVTFLILGGAGLVALRKSQQNSTDGSMLNHTTQGKQQSTQNNSETKETNQVTYKDFAVAPKSIKIKKGTTVTWINQDSAKHDVTPDKETDEFKASELFGKGETYSMTFNMVGTYAYHCSPHPYMKGTIEVVE